MKSFHFGNNCTFFFPLLLEILFSSFLSSMTSPFPFFISIVCAFFFFLEDHYVQLAWSEGNIIILSRILLEYFLEYVLKFQVPLLPKYYK